MGLGLGLVGMAGPAAAQSFEFKPNQRYPDPAVEILDPSFGKYRVYSASVEQLATGFRWAEGPVWFGDGRYVLFSDIPNNRIMRYDEATGHTGVFRYPANFAIGNRDRQAAPGLRAPVTRRVLHRIRRQRSRCSRIASRATVQLPNDIVCKSDGSINSPIRLWITGNYEGKAASEIHGVPDRRAERSKSPACSIT
jgi:gluconolactonase